MANHTMRRLLSRLDAALSSSMEWIRNEKQIKLRIPCDIATTQWNYIQTETGGKDILRTQAITITMAYNTQGDKCQPLSIEFPNNKIWTCTPTSDQTLQGEWFKTLENPDPSPYVLEWRSNEMNVAYRYISNRIARLELSFKPPR